MQNIIITIVAVVVVVVLGALLLVFTSKVITYSLEQEQKIAAEAMATIDELVKRDPVALSDFIEKLGEPDVVANVTCEQNRCIKARWDLSTAFTQCWRRLEVILNEETKKLFYYELAELREIKVRQNNVDVVMCSE